MQRGAKNAETIRRQLKSSTLPFEPKGDGIKTCLRCGEQLLHRLTRFTKAARKTRTGLCPACNCKMATQHGIVPGPKGSLIDRDKRKEGDPHSRWVKCAGLCGKWMFRAIKTWTGVCNKCRRIKLKEELKNGGLIVRKKDAEGNIRTFYRYPPKPKGCGCKREVSPRVADHIKWSDARGKAPLICQPHRLDPYSPVSGEANGNSKERRGPAPKPADKFLADARAVVLELYKELKSDRGITLPKATERLQLLGHDLGEDGIRRKINRKIQKTWEQFVESVLKDCGQVSN